MEVAIVDKLKTVGTFSLSISIFYLATILLLAVLEVRLIRQDDIPLMLSQASAFQNTTIPNIIKESQAIQNTTIPSVLKESQSMRSDMFVALDEASELVDKADKISEHAVGGVLKGVISAPGDVIRGVTKGPVSRIKAAKATKRTIKASNATVKASSHTTVTKTVNKIKFND